MPTLVLFAMKRLPNDVAKQRMLHHFLDGMSLDELRQRGETFAAQHLDGMLRDSGMAILDQHLRAGDYCVLVSASLDLWLQPWVERHGLHALICSRLEVDVEGRVSGYLLNGNCHGQEKVRRILAWAKGRDILISHAYSDSRVDLPMLALARQAYLLKGDSFVLVDQAVFHTITAEPGSKSQ
jgi:HAD superfamily hydrolase (TIGR01490 family)